MTKTRKEFWGIKKAFEIFQQEESLGYLIKSKLGIIDYNENVTFRPVV